MTLTPQPAAGVCLHITSLPGSAGIGELGSAARSFVDWLGAAGLTTWQVLPLGPCGYGDSPYQPLSCFAGNEQLIELAELVELELLGRDAIAPLQTLPRDRVEFGQLLPARTALLHTAARRFRQRADRTLIQEYQQFVDTHDELWLRDYAAYRSLKSQHSQRQWLDWPREHARHRDALASLDSTQRARMDEVRILQFLFARQWAALRRYAHERGVQLMGDMPIYLALDSADAWSRPELLLTDADGRPQRVAGVPPDYFSNDGQLWGNPLYDWPAQAGDGFRWWRARLRHAAERFDTVRIDHFRGFESYWSVPAGALTAREGRWEPGPGDELFAALRSELVELPVVAEDLGIITEAVEQLRDRHGLPGMRVLQFDLVADEFSLAQLRPDTVCYTGTHDNDTTVGWFAGLPPDLQERVRSRMSGQGEPIHSAMVRTAFAAPCRLAVAPLQDYLGLDSSCRLNIPGTASNNWRWRVTAEQLDGRWCEEIAAQVTASGRSPRR
ncbi:MAG: 4-alpha-glucanotransferase [Gammaproteobacteria bacterium]|jgi:4-alpha-glucanotransferase|nr:4-alpha-glucanotransferase [Gammaproteobacteria bacterium]